MIERYLCFFCKEPMRYSNRDTMILHTKRQRSPFEHGMWLAHCGCFDHEYAAHFSYRKLQAWHKKMADAIARGE